MRQQLFILLAFIPLIVNAQTEKQADNSSNFNNEKVIQSINNGIQWTNGLSWNEVLKKAKKENRYIFLDCFTTWCGPCKLMDKEVYSQSDVGTFINEKFISVRVQMDKTKKDNEEVKKWYADADAVQKKYGIPAFPSYLFFSPNGTLVYRETGYKAANDFLSIAKKSVNNSEYPFRKYYELVASYRKGKINYDLLPELIDTAKMLNQADIVYVLEKDYRNYLSNLTETELYTKKKILAIASLLKGADDKFFYLFMQNANKVDSAVGTKGYSFYVVGQIIQKQLIDETFKSNESVFYEPDWNELKTKIAAIYGAGYVEHNILIAKIKWNEKNHDWADTAKYFTLLAKQYDFAHNDRQNDLMLNSIIWNSIFKRSADKEQIDIAIKCMEALIDRVNKRKGPPFVYIDTYANLLYKADRASEAIQQEEIGWKKTIEWKQHESGTGAYLEIIEKMKQGQPTWPHYIDKDDIF